MPSKRAADQNNQELEEQFDLEAELDEVLNEELDPDAQYARQVALEDAQRELDDHKDDPDYEGLTAEDLLDINLEAQMLEEQIAQEDAQLAHEMALEEAQKELDDHKDDPDYEGLTAEDVLRINLETERELNDMTSEIDREVAAEDEKLLDPDELLAKLEEQEKEIDAELREMGAEPEELLGPDELLAKLEEQEKEIDAELREMGAEPEELLGPDELLAKLEEQEKEINAELREMGAEPEELLGPDELLAKLEEQEKEIDAQIREAEAKKGNGLDPDELLAQLEQEEKALKAAPKEAGGKNKPMDLDELISQLDEGKGTEAPSKEAPQGGKPQQAKAGKPAVADHFRKQERAEQLQNLKQDAEAPNASVFERLLLTVVEALNRMIDSPNPMTIKDATTASHCIAALAVASYVKKEREQYPEGDGPFENQFKGKTKKEVFNACWKDPQTAAAVKKAVPRYSRGILANFLADNKVDSVTRGLVQQARREQQAPEARQPQPAPKKLSGLQMAAREDARIKGKIIQLQEDLKKADKGVLLGSPWYDEVMKSADNLTRTWSYGSEAMNPAGWTEKFKQIQKTCATYIKSHGDDYANNRLSPVTKKRMDAAAALWQFAGDRVKDLAPHVEARKNKAAKTQKPEEIKAPVKKAKTVKL